MATEFAKLTDAELSEILLKELNFLLQTSRGLVLAGRDIPSTSQVVINSLARMSVPHLKLPLEQFNDSSLLDAFRTLQMSSIATVLIEGNAPTENWMGVLNTIRTVSEALGNRSIGIVVSQDSITDEHISHEDSGRIQILNDDTIRMYRS